jgi:hypothetical protein
MVYSKAKLKSNGDKASPCIKPFLTGKVPDKRLPHRTMLHISFGQSHGDTKLNNNIIQDLPPK